MFVIMLHRTMYVKLQTSNFEASLKIDIKESERESERELFIHVLGVSFLTSWQTIGTNFIRTLCLEFDRQSQKIN